MISVGHDVPERLKHLHAEEVERVRFRCPHCGLGHEAAVLPGTPQTAKFHCRQCDRVVEVQSRPSAMDKLEELVAEGREKGEAVARRRVYSTSASRKVPTRFGPAYLIG